MIINYKYYYFFNILYNFNIKYIKKHYFKIVLN